MNNSDQLTVKDAEHEYTQKGYCIREWIRRGYLKAQKQGDRFLIDRASLEKYLANKKGPKASDSATLKAEHPGLEKNILDRDGNAQAQQTSGINKFETPPDLWAGAESAVPKEGKSKLMVAVTSPTRQPEAGGVAAKKGQKKQSQQEAKKRFKKGPVRYAKDAMRHFEVVQMVDVLSWLQKRIVAKLPKSAH